MSTPTLQTPLSAATVMTFIYTRDRERAKAFYGGTLGLRLTHEDAFAAVYDLNGIMLRISAVPTFTPHEHTTLGWQVADIEATARQLVEAGVTFTIYEGFGQDVLGIWRSPASDARVAWFKDPDGNVLSLTQSQRR
jgi:predicted enzyme related to lactoylglutathione lyase